MTDLGGNSDVVCAQLYLGAEAAAAGACIVPDCGEVPGMGTSLILFAMEQLEEPRQVYMWDCGLPADGRLAAAAHIARLREISGSKTVFTALAWGVLAALIPVVCSEGRLSAATAVAFLFVAGLVFIHTGLFEILAIEGDRVVGKETLAITLGPKRSLDLLSVGAAVLVVMLLVAAWAGLIPPTAPYKPRLPSRGSPLGLQLR